MNEWRMRAVILTACLGFATDASARSPMPVGMITLASSGRLTTHAGAPPVASQLPPGPGSSNPGTIGLTGNIGGVGIGSGNAGGMIGMCGFGGCFGGPYHCFGSMSGCFGGFPTPTQTFSKWMPSPNKSYYYRVLSVQTPPPKDQAFEFVLVHYPDRPKFFYYFDPLDKKYVGRYRLGVPAEECFHALNPQDRKANLKDIPESAFRNTKGMPTIIHLIAPKAATLGDLPTLQKLKLLRPPESIPDELLGLPAEEPTLKKSSEKK